VKTFFFVSIFLVFSCFSAKLYAQKTYTSQSTKAIKLYEEAKLQYRLLNMPEAEDLLLKAIKADINFQEPYLVIAELYWDQGRYEEAISMYNSGLAIDPTFYPMAFSNKGKLEIRIGRYSDALKSYEKFLELETKNKKNIQQAKRGIEQAKFAIQTVDNPVPFSPHKLSSAINSNDDEYWPSLSADNQTLIFTRLVGSHEGLKKQEDFFTSSYDSSGWSQALDAGAPLNTSDNEGAQSISANGKFMVYTVCNRKGVIGRCDLYYSEKFGDTWSEPKNMGAPINTTSKETQPSLSSDGRTIYFVSDRPGGYGKLDIWMSQLNISGKWSEPINLGDSINTPGQESSPFIHHDNKSLYFSSDYHLGLGGFDLFYSKRNSNGSWSKPINLGYPINTFRDEIGLIVTAKGDRAYFSSDINKETGRDIYQFDLYDEARPEEVSYLKGKVYNARTHQALKASFELYDLADGTLLTNSFSDYRNGEFLICIPTNRNYMLNVSKEGYLFYSENFSLEGVYHLNEPFYKNIPLREIIAGRSIVLRNIFFETDDYTLKPESKLELDKVVKFLNDNPVLKIEISGHTDNQGTENYNLQLSENRAKSVVEFLIAHGINPKRLIAKGYGFSKPIETNDTPEGRSMNRRTELKIIE
jgi:tetratricopeptide (TPR) repeat protein